MIGIGPSTASRGSILTRKRQVEAGSLPNYAFAARALGVARARLTQLLNMLLLAPEIQDFVLQGDVATERRLRAAVREPDWTDQVVLFSDSNNSPPQEEAQE